MLYGFFISLGIVVTALAAKRLNPKMPVWEALPWAIIPGLIGARLYHVIDLGNYYSLHLAEIPAVWNGGLGIFGGLLGGFIGLFIYSRLHHLPLLDLLNSTVVALPLGQAIGRLGNIANGELLPFAYFEILGDLLIFCLLFFLASKKSPLDSRPLLTYIALYCVLRLILQPLR